MDTTEIFDYRPQGVHPAAAGFVAAELATRDAASLEFEARVGVWRECAEELHAVREGEGSAEAAQRAVLLAEQADMLKRDVMRALKTLKAADAKLKTALTDVFLDRSKMDPIRQDALKKMRSLRDQLPEVANEMRRSLGELRAQEELLYQLFQQRLFVAAKVAALRGSNDDPPAPAAALNVAILGWDSPPPNLLQQFVSAVTRGSCGEERSENWTQPGVLFELDPADLSAATVGRLDMLTNGQFLRNVAEAAERLSEAV